MSAENVLSSWASQRGCNLPALASPATCLKVEAFLYLFEGQQSAVLASLATCLNVKAFPHPGSSTGGSSDDDLPSASMSRPFFTSSRVVVYRFLFPLLTEHGTDVTEKRFVL